MPTITAAWQKEAKAKPFEVGPAPYTPPGEGEIVIKNRAVAINPADWAFQERAMWPIQYPTVLGCDAAGEVIEVGPNVTRFSPGDRVVAMCQGAVAAAPYGAFQTHVVVLERVACKIPDSLSFESATVLPLGLGTAATGLFEESHLKLQYPTIDPKPTGKTLLVWGGASSVGCNAVQLAVAAGYEVIATCSSKNFDLMRKLGASQVFDYKSESVIADLVAACAGKTMAGAFQAAMTGPEQCMEVLQKSEGNKFVASAFFVPDEQPGDVKAKFISVSIRNSVVSKVIYEDFLPKALAEGKYIAAPDPVVVGHGVESIQDALEAQKKGVSAQKIVVTM